MVEEEEPAGAGNRKVNCDAPTPGERGAEPVPRTGCAVGNCGGCRGIEPVLNTGCAGGRPVAGARVAAGATEARGRGENRKVNSQVGLLQRRRARTKHRLRHW